MCTKNVINMKKLLIICSLILTSQFSFSQVSFGGGITYDVLDDLGLRVLAGVDVNDEWRGQVSYSTYFNDWTLDLDAQYKLIEFDMDYEDGFILPFAGLNFFNDKDQDENKLGVNLGLHANAGFENYRIFLEPKFTLGGKSGLIISAGVMF